MTTADTVSNELRLRPRFAVVAALGGVLLFGSLIVQSAGPQPKVNELTVQLLVTDRRAGLEVIGAVVSGLGLLGVAATLVFLFGAAKARRPQMSPATRITAMVGAVLAAAGGIGYALVITSKAHQFATHGLQTYPEANALLTSGPVAVLAAAGGIGYALVITSKAHQFATHGLQTYPEANALLTSGPVAVLQYLGLVGSLLLAVGFVLIALNAMRVGLLPKFVGYIGIAAAAASLLLIGSPIGLFVEVLFMLSVAYLLSGRWPSGDPPAWRTGEAVPWPSAAEIREQRQAAAKQRGRQAPKREPARPAPAAANSGARSPAAKRKRKRRK